MYVDDRPEAFHLGLCLQFDIAMTAFIMLGAC